MQSAREVFDTLNTDYLAVHKTKEDLFWSTYMAMSTDDEGFTRAEEAYKNFISDPARLAAVRAALACLPLTSMTPCERCGTASMAGAPSSNATSWRAMLRAR